MPIVRLAVFVLVAFRPAFTLALCGPWRSTYVSFRSSNGEFVAAEGGGGRDLVANRGAVGNWEKFELATVDGTPFAIGERLSLRGWGGQFVVAEPGAILRDNRNAVGDWETFTIESVRRRYDGDCSWSI